MLRWGAVNQETQYFGTGTQVTVLGEHRAVAVADAGSEGPVFVGGLWAVLFRCYPDFRGWQPADRAG